MIPTTGLLLTDLYELAMLEAYFASDMEDEAVFEFFVRELPVGYGYLVAAGIEDVAELVEHARFTDAELDWMTESGRFGAAFVDRLRDFRFTGSLDAMPEGTLFFPDEPVLRITAPLAQAQLLETRIINLLQYPILIATKGSRCATAAAGKQLVDFGLRRAHGAEAGLLAARACYLGGFDGTSTVLAAPRYGIPIYGTMAHSFIEAHDDELAAFEHFALARPEGLVLLIDTYDTEAAARKLLGLAPRLAERGIAIQAVRIDSGDLAEHARRVRRILDAGGRSEIRIFASGGLDEHQLQALLDAGAPIDGFGVGSKLDTSADAPYLDCAYKLMEYGGRPRRKHSEDKSTWPGRKQVVRRFDENGKMTGDQIQLAEEPVQDEGEALLQPIIQQGRRIGRLGTLEEARARRSDQVARLPSALRRLDAEPSYPVSVSDAVRELAREADAFIKQQRNPGQRELKRLNR
jgi:nicotinate phosphoribosyltransferase